MWHTPWFEKKNVNDFFLFHYFSRRKRKVRKKKGGINSTVKTKHPVLLASLAISVYRSARFQTAPWKNTFISACVFFWAPSTFLCKRSGTACDCHQEVDGYTHRMFRHEIVCAPNTVCLSWESHVPCNKDPKTRGHRLQSGQNTSARCLTDLDREVLSLKVLIELLRQ